MRFTGVIIAVTALVIGIATLTSTGTAREKDQTEIEKVEVAQEVPESLMRQKLEHAQSLLSALSIGDFDRMISNAKELQRISLEARWSQPHSPAYADLGEEFRSALERIVLSAEKQNIDSAALNYVQVVLTCVQCHKIVREGEQFAQQAGSDDLDLLQRAMAVTGD
jgi:hypothetical protein